MECMVFSIHDTQTDEVFVASDPSGQKTIYVYEDAESILFSSEMSPLISNQNRIKTLNPSAIGEYIAHEFISGKETHINEISKIGPGCCMRIKHDEDHVYVDHSRFYKALINQKMILKKLRVALDHLSIKVVHSHLIFRYPVLYF